MLGLRYYFISASMALWSVMALGQTTCANGVRVEGTVTDPSGAIVAGASIEGTDGAISLTDAAGQKRKQRILLFRPTISNAP